jgi:enamine deaminase RidA (YjgF/YER057c/UK114 family)
MTGRPGPESPGQGAHRMVTPDGWAAPRGYAHAVEAAAGRTLWIAGQIGWDPRTQQLVSGGFVEQVRQALRNIVDVLEAAGARPEHLVRLTWYVTDRDAYLGATREIGVAYREVMGRHYPAMAVVVVAGLVEEGAMVEIEGTAVV